MPKQSLSFWTPFRFAWEGVRFSFSRHPNTKREGAIAVVAVILGIVLRISRVEWAILILAIGQVFAAEFANTAIEAAVDVATQDLHPKAKIAKDVAAGMVLVAAAAAAIVGAMIFLPKVLSL